MKRIKKTERDVISEILFSIAFGLMILLIIFQAISLITNLEKAYISYKMDCKTTLENPIKETDWAGKYDSSADTISLNPIYADTKTIIHETCHRLQNYQNREYTCKNPIGVFINELECYIAEDNYG